MKNHQTQEIKYTLKITRWISGVLTTDEFIFITFEEARKNSKKYKGYIKIYNHLDQLLHSEYCEEREEHEDHCGPYDHDHHHIEHDSHNHGDHGHHGHHGKH